MGLERVGVDDDFFDVGGYSLIAVRLFAKIKRAYGIDLSLSTLFEAPTIATCAAVIAGELGITLEHDTDTADAVLPEDALLDPRTLAPEAAPATAPELPVIAHTRRATGWSPLVEIQAGSTDPPRLLLRPRRRGQRAQLPLSGRAPRAGQPFYGLQARGVDGKLPPLTRVEDMAALYISEIRRVQPHGPYFLGGYSGGGVIAFEMAQQLRRAGEQTAMLVFIDTFCPVVQTRHHDAGERARRLRERGLVATFSSWIERARYLQRNQLKSLRREGQQAGWPGRAPRPPRALDDHHLSHGAGPVPACA